MRTSFDGLDPVQSTTTGVGTSTLIRDAVGALAEHVTASGEATWDLLDRLGSTVAGATGASITQLSSYDDWGVQQFETAGWSAPENFAGETTDPTQGLNHYYARAFDPSAAAWTSQDPWRGTTGVAGPGAYTAWYLTCEVQGAKVTLPIRVSHPSSDFLVAEYAWAQEAAAAISEILGPRTPPR